MTKKIDKNKISLDPGFSVVDCRKVVLFRHMPKPLQWALYVSGGLSERDSCLLGMVNPEVKACLDYEIRFMADDRLMEACRRDPPRSTVQG